MSTAHWHSNHKKISSASIARFWENYIALLTRRKIKAIAHRYYVRHVENFIDTHSNLRLAQHSPEIIESYFLDQGRQHRLEDWQWFQRVHALEILFKEIVKAPWAQSFSWSYWQHSGRSLDSSHPTVARNSIRVKAQVILHKEELSSVPTKETLTQLIEALRASIRGHHYSIRTEKTYVDWVNRFVLVK